ncbi:MAG: pyroglutamyl-peptidase I [Candidatus Bathyarchaeota archaeon]|nr:pyroglutamyl-peptidase I [Candidatus Bathyarchaeota archaeon]MDH5495460.1 pyroglutamyl-peptidase I [Candidatus Bathyarchaeota archaeon]
MSEIVVLTGFEPFADFQVNPSWEAAKTFDDKEIGSFKVKSFQIPLAYKEIKPTITRIIGAQKPAVIISLGQSYRSLISLEKVAINFADLTESTILYNCETRPKDDTLEPNAPAAYFTTLPIRKILNKLRQNNIPAEISYTAGTFGCNQIFFYTMHKIRSDRLDMRAGFMHIPCLPSQAAQLQKARKGKIPSMNLDTTTKAVEIAIKATLGNVKK